ncbi:dihydrolipoamide acetyltransferase family protein [Solibacillus sp. FSL K6-1554]|uniref:dihydrolipoamide acetyltransferase family protein n=1 Tax=Solibacillus sp. FSL K6-1554 TaxID=2921472 RepID=UPI0030FAD72E
MMEVLVPKIGVEDGDMTLVSWEVDENDFVKKDQAIAIVETEKITSEINSPDKGYIKLLVDENSIVRSKDLIAKLSADKNSETEKISSPSQDTNEPISEIKAETWPHARQPRPGERRKNKKNSLVNSTQHGNDKKITPKAKFLIRELEIDVEELKNTIDAPIIFSRDVSQFNKEKSQDVSSLEKSVKEEKEFELIPFTQLRKTISKNMMNSLENTAQMTLMGELSLNEIHNVYKELKKTLANKDINLSWTVIFLKVIALALKKFPMLNSQVDNNHYKLWKDINIGLAISGKNGLVVPGIANTDKLSISALSQASQNLIELAKNNQLTADHLTNSTFTFTNVGSFGGEFGTPILNVNQVGILAVGKVERKPVINEFDEIVIGYSCYYSLTVDHRVIDGELAGNFIKEIKHILKNPLLIFENGGI